MKPIKQIKYYILYRSLTLFCRDSLDLTFCHTISEQPSKYAKNEALLYERSTIKFLSTPQLKDCLSFKYGMGKVSYQNKIIQNSTLQFQTINQPRLHQRS